MPGAPLREPARRVAFRCDGGEEIGAGHVARGLPLAAAFAQLDWEVVFVGRFDGLARWMLDRAGLPDMAPQAGPAGLRADDWTAAVVDGYAFEEAELCALARALPVAFVGEAARCPQAGIHVDYHAGADTAARGPDVLAGPRFAPVDPRFADADRVRGQVRAALVTVGGSRTARSLGEPAVDALRAAFPQARILVASGAGPGAREGVTALAYPSTLLDVAGEVDVAVSAAGLTAYELAAAGVATVLVALAANQRPVIEGFARAGAALTVAAGAPPGALMTAVERLRDPALRASLRAAGRRLVDGGGAARVAAELHNRWTGPAAHRR